MSLLTRHQLSMKTVRAVHKSRTRKEPFFKYFLLHVQLVGLVERMLIQVFIVTKDTKIYRLSCRETCVVTGHDRLYMPRSDAIR